MIYDRISVLIGMLKMLIYKLFYAFRISFKSIPRIHHNFKIAVRKHSKLIIGKSFRARNNVSFRIEDEGIVKVGSHCYLNDGSSITCLKSIEIGDNVLIGQNVIILDHDHDYKNNIKSFVKENIKIGNNVWIGANCVILKGSKIGDNCVIGAGCVIKGEIEENSIIIQKRETIIKGKKEV